MADIHGPDRRMTGGYAQRRQRAGSLALAILLHLLILALFLMLGRVVPVPVKMEARLKGFFLPSDSQDKGKAEKAETKADTQKAAKSESRAENDAKVTPPPVVTPPEVKDVPSDNKLPYILMTGKDFAASNIGNMPSRRTGAKSGADSKAPYGPGEGPSGSSIYAADWYRRPSSVELSTYIPARAPAAGWGMIACKTIDHYHVDDCYTLGESPLGSGFGRAVREAAWQFLVLPPRVNGKAMVGTWVSIRIDYTEKGGFQPRN